MESVLTKGHIPPASPVSPGGTTTARDSKIWIRSVCLHGPTYDNHASKKPSPKFPIPNATVSSTLLTLTTQFINTKIAF